MEDKVSQQSMLLLMLAMEFKDYYVLVFLCYFEIEAN